MQDTYVSLFWPKNQFKEMGPSFRVRLSLTHPGLIISTSLMSQTEFLDMDTFGHLSIPIVAPKPFFAK